MTWTPLKWALSGIAFAGVFAFVRRLAASGRPSAPSCSTEFSAFNHGPPRDMRKVGIIVLHSTDPPGSPEPTARSTASWFSQPVPISAGGPYSAHVVVGPDGCYRTLSDALEAWGAGDPANLHGLHLEQAGHATWSRAQWLAHKGTISAAAGQAAAWGGQYDIPLRMLYAADLRALDAAGYPPGHGGITTHAEISKAFPHATNHEDPGPGYPLDVFFELAGGTFSTESGA